MELAGAKRCFQFLKDAGLKITAFISDRHLGIAKWIRESEKKTVHYNDLWHVSKGLMKRILNAGKEQGNEIILVWQKAIKKHLYWSAGSTTQGFGDLIVVKWKSLIRHIADNHHDHSDPLYEKCAHGELEPRDWIYVGK